MRKVILLLIVLAIIVPLLMDKGIGQKTINLLDIDFDDIGNIEKNLGQIIKLEDLAEDKVNRIILSLPDLDWDKVNKHGKKLKRNLVEWIKERDIEDVEEISALIKVLSKFSKYDNELLTMKLASIFTEDKVAFIKALALNKDKLLELGYAFHYLEIYGEEGRYLADDFNEILNSDELTKEEKLIGFEFIEIIASCET
ncbi:MAG: NRDE family protein [Tissierellia bacterium]|nr:NRDE family protein [Tissierellia bacterium]